MRVTILEVVLAETPKERIKLSMQYAQSLCRALHLFRLVVQHGHPQTARDIALIKLVEYGHQIFDAFNVDPSDQARARGGQLVKEAFQYMRKSVLHDETELRDRLADILVCVGRAVFNARGYTTPGHPSSTHRWVDLLTEMDIHPPNFTVL